MTTPAERGDALEAAVAAIETHILRTSPALREKTFLIESKKIINVGGVHHEIDIFVTIELGQRYQSVFIFECKNWEDAIGKNEVIVFSEKIAAAQAQRGFFVGKSFTKDAQSQAAKDPRVILLVASEHDPAAAPVPFGFHGVISIPQHSEATFFRRGRTHSELTSIDVSTAEAKLLGEVIDLRQYMLTWAEKTCSDDLLRFRSERLPEGTYDRAADSEREFAPGTLSLNGLDMERATISIGYKVKVVRPAVISYFEVESRGHSLLFSPVQLPTGSTMQMRLISSPPKSAPE
jgi:hypothetical protein